jgi:hypothetical protein
MDRAALKVVPWSFSDGRKRVLPTRVVPGRHNRRDLRPIIFPVDRVVHIRAAYNAFALSAVVLRREEALRARRNGRRLSSWRCPNMRTRFDREFRLVPLRASKPFREDADVDAHPASLFAGLL